MRTNPLRSTLVAAVALLTIAPASAATTKFVKYEASSMKVTRNASGSCWTSSIASTRKDAFRCMLGNEIYDPCFMRGTSSVVCPENLVDNSGLAIELTKPLPPAASPEPAQPWAMILASHITCNRGTGTIDPGYPFYCEGIAGACSAPERSKQQAAHFVTCAGEGKPTIRSHWVVTTVYE